MKSCYCYYSFGSTVNFESGISSDSVIFEFIGIVISPKIIFWLSSSVSSASAAVVVAVVSGDDWLL